MAFQLSLDFMPLRPGDTFRSDRSFSLAMMR